MSIGINDIMVLLGAGASKNAGVPTSWDMIEEIEKLVTSDPEWIPYEKLYCYLKSAIYYADGIGGKFGNKVPYNIERLVNTLAELRKKEEHTIYPFIGNWNIKLVELADIDFKKIEGFQNLILKRLKDKWITRPNYTLAAYFNMLCDFHNELTFPLRVFTLNYDLCIEKNLEKKLVHRGFNQDRKWDWKLFEESVIKDNFPEINVILYKLHGSLDWTRDQAGNLIYVDEPSQIDAKDLAIIFGTDYKLQYVDPFLFYAYEFRKYTLEAKAIICIGYGFADEHINGMIRQALLSDSRKKLICVKPLGGNGTPDELIKIARASLKSDLKIQDEKQIQILPYSAQEYFNNEFTTEKLQSLLPEADETLPF